MSELELLTRAHALFLGESAPMAVGAPDAEKAVAALGAGADRVAVTAGYRRTITDARTDFWRAGVTDGTAHTRLADARAEHAEARTATGRILAEARADQVPTSNSPVAQREALRRRIRRLRAQHRHVLAARNNARRRAAALRALRYLAQRRGRTGLKLTLPQGARAAAVRSALSRLGRPYVWGATGPDTFDCSGLTQWSYRQAGISLPRTTYEQINIGIPVARSDVQPGDLVFPSTGHVQMAIGNGMVIEAPEPGRNVQISRLGSAIAIRRPG